MINGNSLSSRSNTITESSSSANFMKEAEKVMSSSLATSFVYFWLVFTIFPSAEMMPSDILKYVSFFFALCSATITEFKKIMNYFAN